MQCRSASFNSKGFGSSLQSNQIPETNHITYEGAFNQIKFSIGKKAKKSMELNIGYSRCQNQSSCFDNQIHDYIALFTKGSKDGQDRDDRILNAVIALDISGSMSSCLTSKGYGIRIELAKQAIIMFFSKMRDNDSFGLIVFDYKGYTVVPCSKKSQINQQFLFQAIKKIQARGGTSLKSGFDQAHKNINSYLQNFVKGSEDGKMQNRIVMLTDVEDTSLYSAHQFIQNAKNSTVHATIIGISDKFKSQTCQKMKQIKGFNYFCATQVSDLKKYLFENFNYTFFPSNYDIQIGLLSKNIKSFEVFGTVDEKRVKQYNNNFENLQTQTIQQKLLQSLNNNYAITKTKTFFPSELQFEKDDQVKQFGGLIIIKLSLKQKVQKFDGTITLKYKTPQGQKFEQLYPLDFHSPLNQQYYSDQSLEEAMSSFHYVFEVKKLLEQINKEKRKYGNLNRINKQERCRRIQSLKKLQVFAPKSKLNELQKLISVLNETFEKDTKQINFN